MPVSSPIDITDLTLRLTVKVNGSAIKDYYPIVSIHIIHEINKISTAEIVMIDGTVESEDVPISDGNDFIPGNDIEIMTGYEDAGEHIIFSGIIIKHAVKLDRDNGFNLVVSCKHKAVRMTFNRTEEEYENITDSDIIAGIVSKYGLSATIDKTDSPQEIVYQKAATDWDFILSRAGFYGYVTLLDGEKMFIGKPAFDGEPLLKLRVGESIISFHAELNAERQPSSLTASAWDPDNQQLITSDASEPTVNSQGNMDAKSLSTKLNQTKLAITSTTPMPQDQLKTWADGKLLMMRMNAIKGQVTFIGNAEVKTGGLIELDGVGDRFNGKAYISSISHTIEEGIWNTKVRFGFDAKPIYEQADFSYPAATGQLPAIHSLQIGIVEKIFSDEPVAKYKILIRLASSAEDQNGMWARISNFYATSGEGAFFLPEVGDEVVVGFLESDPRYPIILGSLYSNSREPELEVTDNNNYIKSFTTKGKLKVTFDDKKKITTIETPAGNSITLNDDKESIEMKDISNNTVIMNSNGISMESKKDISIKATGSIKLDASDQLILSAMQDVEVTGANIKNEAKAGFTAKGNASAEISASGLTTVKGGIVTIN